jgi:CRISP-associated protein Cas1
MMPLRWKDIGRKPIQPEWHHMVARPSMVSDRNRNASHPVNAMLSYAFAVLESQVPIATVAQGLDPTIGYVHVRRPGRAALLYDLMEPLRQQLILLVLDFLIAHTFHASDIILESDGVCRLHPQLARQISGSGVNDIFVHEIVSSMVTKLKTVHAE